MTDTSARQSIRAFSIQLTMLPNTYGSEAVLRRLKRSNLKRHCSLRPSELGMVPIAFQGSLDSLVGADGLGSERTG